MLAAPSLALEAHARADLLLALIPLGLGVLLLTVGVRRRRARALGSPALPAAPTPVVTAPAASSWTPAPAEDEADDAVAPTDGRKRATSRGGVLMAAGVGLIALALVAAGLRATAVPAPTRRVALPTSVLGMARDAAATEVIYKRALSAGVPAGLEDPQVAAYGMPPAVLLVIAGRVRTSRPSRQLDGFRRGLEKSGGRLEHARDVDPGPLGGAARCWDASISDVHPGVCVFVDDGSLVATLDFLGGGLDAAAKRGLQVRATTVHRL